MSGRLSLVACAVLLVATFARPAVADDEPCARDAAAVAAMKTRDHALQSPSEPEAKAHMEVAKRAYGVGEYEKAIDEYIAAGLKTNSTLVLYNLAQTHRAAKDYEKAIRQYRLFLDRGRPGPEVTSLVMCLIATMEAEMKHAASTAPPTGPATEGTDVPPSRADASPVEAPVPPPAPGTWTTGRTAALGLGVGSLVAGAVGVAFNVRAIGFRDDARALCPMTTCANAATANELVREADADDRNAVVAYAAGAAALTGAIVLWFLSAPEAPVVQPRVHMSSTEVTVQAHVRF